MSWLVVVPLLAPLTAAAAGLTFYRALVVQRAIAVAGAAGLLASGIALLVAVLEGDTVVARIGGWDEFGIVLIADRFSAMMVVLAGIIGLVVVPFSFQSVGAERERSGYYPLVMILLLGVTGAFLTGDIFNLYVWFEVMLIASFVLVALGNERPQLEGAIKYVTLNLLSSLIFLTGVGLLYGLTGTLNLAALAVAVPELEPSLRLPVAMLFLTAFAIKAGAFPLFMWLPASYHTPPFAVSALFAALLTKVGVYALIRLFTLVFIDDEIIRTVVLVAAGLTMAVGVLGAMAQHEIRRILSFHIVSQIGYMLVGLALFTQASLAASIFYIAHHIIVKSALFLVAGVIHGIRGTGELPYLGGLVRTNSMVAVLFAIPALSLAGIPPFSGFIAKLAVLRAALDEGSYVIAGILLAVGLLTIFSMMKIWNEAFLKPAPGDADQRPQRVAPMSMMMSLAALVFVSLGVAAAAQPVYRFADDAAQQLMTPDSYVEAVLGATP
ncbi:MAG: proton-conducting transporter membrane subunit [Dehalococcoidia bacterium]